MGCDDLVIICSADCSRGNEMRKEYWEKALERFDKMRLVAEGGLKFFMEALSCFQNCAFMATIAMCGFAVEALLYDLVSALKGGAVCDMEGNVKPFSHYMDVHKPEFDFGKVIEEAKGRRLVDRCLEQRINEIRKLRNIVAHYTQRRMKGTIRLYEHLKAQDIGDPSIEWGDWASEEEALQALRDTAEVMRVLIEKGHELLCGRGPRG